MARDLFKQWQASRNNSNNRDPSFADLKSPSLRAATPGALGAFMIKNQGGANIGDGRPRHEEGDEDDEDDDESESESDVEANETDSDVEQVTDDKHIHVRRSPFMRLDKFRGTVMEHRELMMEQRLSIPEEHPRFASNEEILLGSQGGEGWDCGDGGRQQRSNSIE